MEASPIPLAWGSSDGGQAAAREALYASGSGHSHGGAPAQPPGGRVLWPLGLKEQVPPQDSISAGPPVEAGRLAPASASPDRAADGQWHGGGWGAGSQLAPDFVPAPAFAGSQPGYVFKVGPQGLGYYADAVPQPMAVPPAGSAAAMPKQQACAPPQSPLPQGLQGVPAEQQAVYILKEMLYRLPASADAVADGKSVLHVLRELQVQSERGNLAAWGGPDEEVKLALVGAIKWALQQNPQILEDLVFACLVMVNMGPPSGAQQKSSNIVFIPMLIDTIKTGPVQSKTHCAVVLSQIVLEGAPAVEAIVHYPEFLHHCTMLVCSSSDDAKSEAALLVNNLAALADEEVQSRLSGHAALVGALKSVVQYGGPVQQCRSAGAFMHLSKASIPREALRSSRANEALENTIRARIKDKNPTPDQRATLGLATMAHINLMAGSAALLPLFQGPDARFEASLVQLLIELLISSVQQRALFGINWRLKDVLWSVRVLAGNISSFTLLLKSGLVEILGMIQESKHTSAHGQDADLIKKLVHGIHTSLVQSRQTLQQEEQERQARESQTSAAATLQSIPPTQSSASDGISLLLQPGQSAESIPSLYQSKTTSPAPQKQATPAQSLQPGAPSIRSQMSSPPSQVHERLFLRCVKRIQVLQMLQAFNTWVGNMRSDRNFLDSKLYTKLVNQLAKERVRNVDLERSLHELKQANQSAPQATNSPTESIQQNTRVKQLEAELVAKQERIAKLENIHRDSVEQLVRERVALHLGALAEQTQGDAEEVQQLQSQLREKREQLETAGQRITALEAQMTYARHKPSSPNENSHKNPSSPLLSCTKSYEPEGEEMTMQKATAEVNTAVAKLVDVLHTELRERADSHSAIMTAIANTVAVRCSAAPPSPALADTSAWQESVVGGSPQKNQALSTAIRSPPAVAVQQDTASLASDMSTSSQRTSAASRNSSPDIPSSRPISELEARHSSILALTAKLRVG